MNRSDGPEANRTATPKSYYQADKRSSITLLLLAFLGIFWGTISMPETYQALGPIISALILVIIVWLNFIGPLVSRKRSQKPFKIYFLDNDYERVESHDADKNSEIDIQLRMIPHFNISGQEIVFGFYGGEDEKPIPISTFEKFIKIGSRRTESPDSNPDHYRDIKGFYHTPKTRSYAKGTVYALGFRVKTHKPGKYKLFLRILRSDGESQPKNEITLNVLG